MASRQRGRVGGKSAFTLIELLTVIGIIVLVLALALPNFVAMMKGRKWTTTIGSIQTMVMRARALATNARKDMSVEFDIQVDNGTRMWLESEDQMIERLPDMVQLQRDLGGYAAVYWLLEVFRDSGITKGDTMSYECRCRKANCRHEWVQSERPTSCPKCGATGWPYWPEYTGYYLDFEVTGDPSIVKYGDNAHQSEVVLLPRDMTIDDSSGASPNFINWDHPDSVDCYGGDEYKDIRIGTNGALVQTSDPVICLKNTEADESRKIRVIRCTGRLVPAR